jgi:hypothetical protein
LLCTRFIFNAGQQYGSQFVLQPAVWIRNAVSYLQTPAAIWSASPTPIRYALALITLALASVGLIQQFARPTVAEFYFLALAAVLIVYHVNDTRYALPLLPLILIYASAALHRLGGAWQIHFPRLAVRSSLAPVACATACLALSALNLRGFETGPIREGVGQSSFLQLTSFLSTNTPANGLILSWNPRVLALYTGRRSALYPETADLAGFERQIPVSGPVFLVVYDRQEGRDSPARLLSYPALSSVQIYRNSDFQIYSLSLLPTPGSAPKAVGELAPIRAN